MSEASSRKGFFFFAFVFFSFLSLILTVDALMKERVSWFKERNMLLQAQRIEQRTRHDLEMLKQTGVCSGIENYSRWMDGRAPGESPFTLLHYFPE